MTLPGDARNALVHIHTEFEAVDMNDFRATPRLFTIVDVLVVVVPVYAGSGGLRTPTGRLGAYVVAVGQFLAPGGTVEIPLSGGDFEASDRPPSWPARGGSRHLGRCSPGAAVHAVPAPQRRNPDDPAGGNRPGAPALPLVLDQVAGVGVGRHRISRRDAPDELPASISLRTARSATRTSRAGSSTGTRFARSAANTMWSSRTQRGTAGRRGSSFSLRRKARVLRSTGPESHRRLAHGGNRRRWRRRGDHRRVSHRATSAQSVSTAEILARARRGVAAYPGAEI